jgi:hypothetical protein
MTSGPGLFDIAPYTTNWRLDERFGIPPFSTLDTRSGTWRNRRARWLELDMTSTDGRAERLTFVASRPGGKMATDDVSLKIMAVGTTSEFDPLLCEAAIRWWSPAGGVILDPFAGGSVRGIVSGILGREYHGVDLSVSQVTANERTLARLAPIVDILEPRWYTADSAGWQPDIEADFIFSCPPYGSLEKYSDDPADLSNMRFEDFANAYWGAIAMACARLKVNRFACFVVGNYREGQRLRDLVGLTVSAFEDCGLIYHADLALMNSTATAGMRASAQFNANRKPVMCHQHVVVMCKGDPKVAADATERLDPLDVEGDVGSDSQPFPLEDGVRRL